MRARVVVVAADALRTPQLLWASGIRPDALGRYLNDQAQVVFAVRIRDAERLAPAGAGDQVAAAGTLSEQSGVSWVPFTDDMPFHGQVMQLDASPVPLADDDPVVAGLHRGARAVLREGPAGSTTASSSRTTTTDAYGMPAMRIHYRLTDATTR